MNILEKIVADKKEEVLVRKIMVPVEDVVSSIYFDRKCFSLVKKLQETGSTGIIAEFKRRSPSKGFINQYANVHEVTTAYTNGGASGLSVLTDHPSFAGSSNDISIARINDLPILRKEFIVDPYQILTTKALGADVILLIAAILSKEQVKEYASAARDLGLEVILEIHEKSELGHICNEIDIIGINNRNLKTFEVDINTSIELGKLLPANKLRISESGISNIETINRLKKEGFNGFLIGEVFMKQPKPGEAFLEFIKQLNDSK